ncbi:Protocadherin gamma-A8 [Merluccius polli]|uniref:Protocadherin gamma-A8 n=1 Tax=Merluccius polli TaxID=89951 RepID=A0AA47MYK1_MERPO|nr:Protocadherin gamma-A8 [Merluccius polli]
MQWRTKRVDVLFILVLSFSYVLSQVSYSIPEEMATGSVVGNIVQDLALDVKRLKSGKARVYTGGSTEYISLDKERGVLVIKEKIDRELLCGETTPCVLHFQIIIETPMELFRVTVEITDINDNTPSFSNNVKRFEISESAIIGSKFVLEKAIDLDIGLNGLQSYSLNPTDNFALKLENQPDGSKKVDMVLQKSLDREQNEQLSLLLTAMDGGEPQMSGTMQIYITVLDANDNSPVFTKPIYKAKIMENSPKGTTITTVSATDKDKGSNGDVSYLISNSKHRLTELFQVDKKSGEIILIGEIDYEKAKHYQIDIEAVDNGGLSDSSKLIVDVIDTNDNRPHPNIVSMLESILEDSPPNTVIAMLSITDPDSENNGEVECNLIDKIGLPFKIDSTMNGFYSVTTEVTLDREVATQYNITVTCSDRGVPSLSSSVTLSLKITDINDNAPVFESSSYEAFVVENNAPGIWIFTMNAIDADWNQNARVSYILEDSFFNGVPVSSYVSVSADSGVIHAVRSFDYEQIKDFQFRVKAQDGGSPPLSSNVSVKILIQDQNDNAPQVLYPVQTGGSLVAEMVPRSADVGYLVTKVVAVDVDSGQNAWLSYKLQKATDRALFEVGLQNGEIRTIRQVTDKDAVKQRLTVIVEDNGQPSRSATVIVNVAVADSFPEVLSEFTDFTHDKEYNDNLTFYLVLALAVVSFLFITCLVVIISVKIYRWRQSRILYHSNLPVIPYYPPRYSDTLGTGTLQHVYNYEVCRTTDSRKSDCKFGRAGSQNVLIMDPSSTGTMQRIQSEKSILDEPDSPLEITYSIPEEMSKGSLVGNIAGDLGLDLKRLKTGKARLHFGNVAEYISLDKERGVLLVKESIDRETVCKQTTPCALHFQIILENPIEFYRVTVEIKDVNDNAPVFKTDRVIFEISESAAKGAKFILEPASDSDVGENGLKSYSLNPTDHFILKLHDHADGRKEVEMVLQKPLDRENQEQFNMILTAIDGGEPQLSGTAQIEITVLDANDNAPTFTHTVYTASLVENSPKGTLVTIVSASDKDHGSNGQVTYSISSSTDNIVNMFKIDENLGQIHLSGELDYETSKHYQIDIKAKDLGGLYDSCKIMLDVTDVNDNSPVIDLISTTPMLSEDATLQTVVAVMSAHDPDSENNGEVTCALNENIEFSIKTASNGFYSLVTDSILDRERAAEYNITVTCSDQGVPALSSSVTLRLQVSDVNDNAPVFERGSYEAFIVENNTPGVSIHTIKASDVDWKQNARVSYILDDSSSINGVPVSSYVSVSADSGVIHAVRSFDHEQIKHFQFRVTAQDGGSPPLSSNASVKILIQDQNDNAPQVLYPVQTGGSLVAEIVPRSADVGYLVTKVVAVDVDSGQNAWLSYKLQKATDRALFEVGLQNGEIRTIRQVTDKDVVKQRLTVIVEDNGQPSRSATVVVNVAVADSFPEVLSEFTDFTHDKEYNDNLTFYLVLALAVVSFLFITCLVVIISVKIYRWRQSRILYHSNLPVIPYYPPRYSDTLGTGTLQHVYNYEVCRTTDSRKSDCKFGRAGSQNVLIMDPSSTGTMQRIQCEKSILDEPDSPLEELV